MGSATRRSRANWAFPRTRSSTTWRRYSPSSASTPGPRPLRSDFAKGSSRYSRAPDIVRPIDFVYSTALPQLLLRLGANLERRPTGEDSDRRSEWIPYPTDNWSTLNDYS